jgi:hypothetical protein
MNGAVPVRRSKRTMGEGPLLSFLPISLETHDSVRKVPQQERRSKKDYRIWVYPPDHPLRHVKAEGNPV